MLGLDDADLPLELVRRSDLYVVVLEQDKEKIARARRRYDALGLYGTRIAVHQGDLTRPPYASYFANLIVVPDPARCNPKSVYRCLRPCGGVLALAGAKTETAEKWLARSGAGNISAGDRVAYLERGPLPGAGTWSHPFANPGRTTATGDKYVRLPLETLWFGGPGPARMVDRHRYSPIPVYADGRLFVSGQDTIIAVDAYNGREMWSRRFEGVGRYPGQYRGPSVVADETCAFVPYGLQCFRLDGDTGKTLVTYNLPQEVDMGKVEAVKVRKEGAATAKLAGSRVEWNYLAVTEGAVVGTVGPSNIRGRLQGWPTAAPRGKYLFAFDKASGKARWVYELEHTVTPSAIVIGGGRVFLLDQKATVWNIEKTVLKALDLKTGEIAWSKPIDEKPWELMLSGNHLLVAGRVYTVLDPKTGRQQWSRRVPLDDYAKYGPAVHHYQWAIAHHPYNVVPPLIVGGKIITPPWAYDLETGQPLGRTQPVSGEASLPVGVGNGGCGTYSACPAAMFLRSGALGIYDLENDTGMHWLGQIRPGCWINTLPAGGILLVPEAASSCSCAYSFQTSVALIAAKRQEEWGAYACELPGQGARVKKVCLNFGAVGDKRDPGGKLWLAFPRPFSPQALRIPLTTSPKTEAYRENADAIEIAGTDRPWLYASGVKGMETAALDLQLRRPAVVLEAEKAPQIDGVLDDECWNGAEELRLVDDFRRESSAGAWLRYDSQNLYIGFRREAAFHGGKPVPWTMNTEGDDAPAWQDDSLKVRFDPNEDAGWYLFLSASGARFTGTGGGDSWRIFSGKDRKTKWKSATHVTDKAWSAEIAIPFRGPGSGMNIFLESFNRTGVGPERAFYQFRSWRRWFISGGEADLVFQRPPASPERTFRVKLHFAELEDVKPGQRVFDVRLQGKTVIRALDVVKEAGRRCRAVTREFSDVKAAETISIGLVPARGSKRPAILSGVEIQEEESR